MISLILMIAAVVILSSTISSVDSFQFQFQDSTSSKMKNGPKNRRDVLIATVTSTTASPALISLLTFPQPVQAAAKDESMNYQAVWFDSQHPNGYRIVYGDDQSATLLLKDTPEDDELILPVKVMKEEGKDTKLLFDFSKLGLSNAEEGTLRRRKSDKVRIISFDNGNNEWINKKVSLACAIEHCVLIL